MPHGEKERDRVGVEGRLQGAQLEPRDPGRQPYPHMPAYLPKEGSSPVLPRSEAAPPRLPVRSGLPRTRSFPHSFIRRLFAEHPLCAMIYTGHTLATREFLLPTLWEGGSIV